MPAQLKTFTLAALATAALVACGGGSDNVAPQPTPSQANVNNLTVVADEGDTWLITYNTGNAAAASNITCKKDEKDIPLPANQFVLEVLSGGGILKNGIGECLPIQKSDAATSFEIDSFKIQANEKSEVSVKQVVIDEQTGAKQEKNLNVKKIEPKDKIKLAALEKYIGTYETRGFLRYINPDDGEGSAMASLSKIIKDGNDYKLLLGGNEYLITEENGLLKASTSDKTDAGYIFLTTETTSLYESKKFSFDRTIYRKTVASDQLIAYQTGIFNLSIPAEVYESATTPDANDPRYGNGGKVITNGTAFPLEDTPVSYKQEKANYFVFRITDNSDYATGQFYTAGKLTDPTNQKFTGYDFKFFSVQTNDGFETNQWSEVKYGKETNDGNILIACTGTGSEKSIIAISEKAEVVTNVEELYGKTFKEYSCGVNGDDWEEFSTTKKTPFDFAETITISSTGNISSSKEDFGVNVKSLVGKDGFDSGDYKVFATAYKLNGQYYVLQKDYDTERKDNSSMYGLSLMISQ